MESNDSPEIPDRGETSDIPGLPSGIPSGHLWSVIWTVARMLDSSQGLDILLSRGHLCCVWSSKVNVIIIDRTSDVRWLLV